MAEREIHERVSCVSCINLVDAKCKVQNGKEIKPFSRLYFECGCRPVSGNPKIMRFCRYYESSL